MKRILNFTILIFNIFVILSSCSSDDDYDKSKAISAIGDENKLSIDPNLQQVTIKVPQQVNFDYYDQTVQNNQKTENFLFSPIDNKKNKFLTKRKKTWSVFNDYNNDDNVFEPIINDNIIYLLNSSGVLSSYNIDSKKRIYKKRVFPKKYFQNYQNPRISFYNDKIFAIAGTDTIYAIDAKSAQIKWSKKILSIPISTIVADDENIYLLTNDNKSYAINSKTGKIKWKSSSFSQPTAIFDSARPVIYSNKIFISHSNGQITCLDKSSGKTLWSQNLNLNKAIDSDFYLNDIDATPVVRDNVIYAVGNGGILMAIDINNGKFIWKQKISSITDLWLASEFIFMVDNKNRLISLSQKNGKIKYIKDLGLYYDEDEPESKIIYNSIIMAGDKLLITSQKSKILVADPQNGKIEQTFKVKQRAIHPPIVVNGKILLHTMGKFRTNLIEIW